MKRFARALAVTLGLVVLGSVISLAPQKNATSAGSAPVSVVNTPLPVTGTVAAQQSGAWNVGLAPNTTVGISGNVAVSGTVGITGNPGVTVANGNSQPVPTRIAGASLVTHVGQIPSNHVVLTASTLGCNSWNRVNPDGTFSGFTIPAGFDLVITDAELFHSGATPGNLVLFGLSVPVSGTVMMSSALADPAGNAAIQEHLTSGIVLSVLPVCGPSAETNGVIRGYMIPAS